MAGAVLVGAFNAPARSADTFAAPPIVEARWLDPDSDRSRALTERPPAAGDIQGFFETFGRLAFRSPLTLGGYAARNGLSCAVCHPGGGAATTFFVPSVSDRPGNIDVSSVYWHRRGDNGKDDPTNIPAL